MKIKLSSLLILFVFLASISNAQTDFKKVAFGIGAAPAIGLGDLGKNTLFGYGAAMQVVYRFSNSYEAFIEPCFTIFSTRNLASGIPVGIFSGLAGARYIFPFRLTAGVGLGYGSIRDGASSGGGFAYAPTIGYQDRKYAVHLFYSNIASSGSSVSLIGARTFWMF